MLYFGKFGNSNLLLILVRDHCLVFIVIFMECIVAIGVIYCTYIVLYLLYLDVFMFSFLCL